MFGRIGAVLALVSATSARVHSATPAVSARATEEDGPNPIYDVLKYRKKVKSVKNGVMFEVAVPGSTKLQEIHMFGTAKERGYAQGQLLGKELHYFGVTVVDKYYADVVEQLKQVQNLPVDIKKIVDAGWAGTAPYIFAVALDYVYYQQKEDIAASKANYWEEIDSMAQGACDAALSAGTLATCDAPDLAMRLKRLNLLPELIRMQCSMMGAWGAATPDGNLVQLRSLDFGSGPFPQFPVLQVHHPGGLDHAWASLAFPGMVGAITGISEKIALCEKVDDVYSPQLPPRGDYEGQAATMVLSDILQFATTKEEGVEIMQAAKRTWPIWVGLGDYTSQEFLATLYTRESATPYDDVTLPLMTGSQEYKSVAYLDKHPQPTHYPHLFGDLVKDWYGNLTAVNVAQQLPRAMQTGDVHIAVYDLGPNRQLSVALGQVNADTGAFIKKAYQAPYLRWNLEDLWNQTMN
jgi:hypothetical protein